MHLGPRIAQIVVVDNASSDSSRSILEELERELPSLVVVLNSSNVGLRRAINQALRLVSSPVVLVLNPDTFVTDSSSLSCLTVLESDSDVACAFPSVEQIEYPTIGYAFRTIVPFLWSAVTQPSQYLQLGEKHELVDVIGGAFYFVRSESLRRVGGFDDDLFLFWEEEELSAKFSICGLKKIHVSEAKAYHVGAESFRTSKKRREVFVDNTFAGSVVLYTRYYNDNGWVKLRWYALYVYKMLLYAVSEGRPFPLRSGLEALSKKVGSGDRSRLGTLTSPRFDITSFVKLHMRLIRRKKPTWSSQTTVDTW